SNFFLIGPCSFRCHQCRKTYKYRRNLLKHINYECGIEPKFACPYCTYKAKQKITLRSHMINRHGNDLVKIFIYIIYVAGERNYYCGQCGRSYKRAKHLYRHRKFECGKEPTFACEFPGCTFKCKRKDNLKLHQKTHWSPAKRNFVWNNCIKLL
ncbi:zinc finger protein 567-like, partial [Agrilus planipennis]|uniref:Zinc finger protein 567-like n=1 Tax=Agrilus planipennis TaxID=224129 RepID=A0A7F5R1T9_AGRPL